MRWVGGLRLAATPVDPNMRMSFFRSLMTSSISPHGSHTPSHPAYQTSQQTAARHTAATAPSRGRDCPRQTTVVRCALLCRHGFREEFRDSGRGAAEQKGEAAREGLLREYWEPPGGAGAHGRAVGIRTSRTTS